MPLSAMTFEPIPVLELDEDEGQLYCTKVVDRRSRPSPPQQQQQQQQQESPSLTPPSPPSSMTDPAFLHAYVSHELPVDDLTAARLLGVHLGQSSLDVADVTSLFLLSERRLRLFASCIPEFARLTAADQDSLVLANAPLYFQLQLACYINGADGLGQLRRILRLSTGETTSTAFSAVEELSRSGNLLTLTFGYFNSVVSLFTDRLWESLYDMMLCKFQRAGDVVADDEEVLGLLTACIVFSSCQEQQHSSSSDFDEPDWIAKGWGKFARRLCHLRRPGFSSGYEVAGKLNTLRSMAAFYAAHANIHHYQEEYCEAPLSFPMSVPSPAGGGGDDSDWLQWQICCLERSWQDFGGEGGAEEEEGALVMTSLLTHPDSFESHQALTALIERRMRSTVSALEDLDWPSSYWTGQDDKERNVWEATRFVMFMLEAVTESGIDQVTFLLGRSVCQQPESFPKMSFDTVKRYKGAPYLLSAKEIFRHRTIFAVTCLMILRQTTCQVGSQGGLDRLRSILWRELTLAFGEVKGTAYFTFVLAAIHHS